MDEASSVRIVAGQEVRFDPEACLIRITFKGVVTRESLGQLAKDLYSHAEYDQEWNALIDMGAATFDVSFSDLFHYVDRVRKDSRRLLGAAVLVSPSLLHFGIGRMYGGIAGDGLGRLRIERTVESAMAWLQSEFPRGSKG